MQNIFDTFIFNTEQISIALVSINLFFCIIISFFIRFFYLNYSTNLSNKNQIADIITLLAPIIFFIIVIIKSSIALSLGLVGALSIVRFRTPIKEPEELIYLFFSIAVGISFGAFQTIIAIFISLIILLLIFIRSFFSATHVQLEFNFVVEWKKNPDLLKIIINELDNISTNISLEKFSNQKDLNKAIILLTPKNLDSLLTISTKIKEFEEVQNCSYYKHIQIL